MDGQLGAVMPARAVRQRAAHTRSGKLLLRATGRGRRPRPWRPSPPSTTAAPGPGLSLLRVPALGPVNTMGTGHNPGRPAIGMLGVAPWPAARGAGDARPIGPLRRASRPIPVGVMTGPSATARVRGWSHDGAAASGAFALPLAAAWRRFSAYIMRSAWPALVERPFESAFDQVTAKACRI